MIFGAERLWTLIGRGFFQLSHITMIKELTLDMPRRRLHAGGAGAITPVVGKRMGP